EKQTALEAAKGFSNKEIARLLNITERTVKAHISKVYEKLGVKDRLQLALMLNNNPAKQPVKVAKLPSKKTSRRSDSNQEAKKKLEYVA
ncbi:unnamed protein product, partial [Chrysoparadoxa australica]